MSKARESERVEVYVPRASANDEPNLFIGVNGRSWLLPKGQKSMIPMEAAMELMRSMAAQEEQDRKINAMLAQNTLTR